MVAKIISRDETGVVMEVRVNFNNSMLDSEKNLQVALNEAGVLASGELLETFDANGKPLQFGSVTMTSKGKQNCFYQTPYGEIEVARHVYQTNKGGKTFCPLENSARIVGSATPFFAKQISYKYSDLGASRVSEDFSENHSRNIAKSFIQNVADRVASVAQAHEESWNYITPKFDEKVTAISIGVDGTCMLTVTDGWRQAMVGTLALYSKKGDRLHTIYLGATPEYGKETFLSRMEKEIEHIKKLYPKALSIGIADGAKDNWTFLEPMTDKQILDFYHASEYLTKVADAVFPNKKAERDQWLEDACHRLKHNHTGPAVLLKEMIEFRTKHLGDDRRKILEASITYFKNNKKRMKYAENVAKDLPIGSGVTEAACKVIVKQRLCNSGMRWKEEGAACVLSLRTLTYTPGRWEQFWNRIDKNGLQLSA